MDSTYLSGREIDPGIKQLLSSYSTRLNELTNFGIKILLEDLNSQRGGEYLIPGFLFLRNELEIIESISSMIAQSIVEPSKILLRSLLETYWQMLHLFEGDQALKGKSFIVWHTQENLKIYKKMDGVSEEYKKLVIEFAKIGLIPRVHHSARQLIASAKSLLEKPEYQEVNSEYDELKSKSSGRVPYWFSLFGGPRNIRELANSYNLTSFYEVLYRTWSDATHGSDILGGRISRNEEGNVQVLQLRLPDNAKDVVIHCYNLALLSFDLYMTKRLTQADRNKLLVGHTQIVSLLNEIKNSPDINLER